ncbi:hypothetical protein D3C72_1210400 [compost metagenome]
MKKTLSAPLRLASGRKFQMSSARWLSTGAMRVASETRISCTAVCALRRAGLSAASA